MEEQVKDYLEKLDVFISAGPDEIHSTVLKQWTEVNAESLVIIFKISWRSGETPKDQKRSNIVPIFNKGNKILRELWTGQPNFDAQKDTGAYYQGIHS